MALYIIEKLKAIQMSDWEISKYNSLTGKTIFSLERNSPPQERTHQYQAVSPENIYK